VRRKERRKKGKIVRNGTYTCSLGSHIWVFGYQKSVEIGMHYIYIVVLETGFDGTCGLVLLWTEADGCIA